MGDDFNVDEGEINEMKQDMKVSVICVYNKTDVFKNLLIRLSYNIDSYFTFFYLLAAILLFTFTAFAATATTTAKTTINVIIIIILSTSL